MTSLEGRLARLEQRQRLLATVFATFAILHALIIPLLPELFGHASQASVGALVIACAILALVVTRRGIGS